MLRNESDIPDSKVEQILALAARLLIHWNCPEAASIVANAEIRVTIPERLGWNNLLYLTLPATVYFSLERRENYQDAINEALKQVTDGVPGSACLTAIIVTELEHDPDWRNRTNQTLRGEGINNQGRVRSDNIATRQHDGLLFRSKNEVHFYDAIKGAGVPFAPLSVVLQGGMNYRRVEPDFLIYQHGTMLVVEIDSDLYHSENAATAEARLNFIIDGGYVVRHVDASECDTPQKAQQAVRRVLGSFKKQINAR